MSGSEQHDLFKEKRMLGVRGHIQDGMRGVRKEREQIGRVCTVKKQHAVFPRTDCNVNTEALAAVEKQQGAFTERKDMLVDQKLSAACSRIKKRKAVKPL